MTKRIAALAAAIAALFFAASAEAGLEVCNETAAVQSVSIAYQGTNGWVSEGWWNVDPGACLLPLAGDLQNRYYYYRAEVDAGDFDGEGYLFCTTPEAYTIEGDTNCEARGYDTEDFREIDTGPTATHYTLTLVDPEGVGPASADSGDGLVFCNDTQWVQSVSIGYQGEDDWTSEGWWNIEPDDCMTVITGALDLRYYYYRAEVEGGTFDGEGYYFCTSPDAYTIVGDANCRARGYDEEEFAEIDVEDYTSFTLTLVDTSAPPPPPVRDTGKPPAAETSKGTTDVPTFERKVTPRPPRGN